MNTKQGRGPVRTKVVDDLGNLWRIRLLRRRLVILHTFESMVKAALLTNNKLQKTYTAPKRSICPRLQQNFDTLCVTRTGCQHQRRAPILHQLKANVRSRNHLEL
jgi:hypothetical protein